MVKLKPKFFLLCLCCSWWERKEDNWEDIMKLAETFLPIHLPLISIHPGIETAETYISATNKFSILNLFRSSLSISSNCSQISHQPMMTPSSLLKNFNPLISSLKLTETNLLHPISPFLITACKN